MTQVVAAVAGLIPPLGIVRLLVVVEGGLVVLQSSQSLGPAKLGYLALVGVALAFSSRSVWHLRDRPMFKAGLPWLIASLLLGGLIALSLPVALAHGTPITQWLRDAATYGLLAAAPVIALDAAASRRRGLIQAVTVATMGLGALSYAVYWIDARNLAALPFERLLLPTASLPTALFVVSLGAAVIDGPRRLVWVLLGGLTLGVFLIAGSRSALFFFIAMPVAMAVAGRLALVRSAVASAAIGLVATAFVVIVQFSVVGVGGELAPPIDVVPPPSGVPGSSPGASPTVPPPTPRPTADPDAALIPRIQAFLTSPERDGSLRERVAQYGVAWDLFVTSPVVGVGLGHPFEWTRVDGTIRRDFTADTPLILPAKLGLIGVAWLAFFGVVWIRFLRQLWHAAGATIPGIAMAGWAAIVAVLAWGSFVLEDKGFSYALMLLLAFAFIEFEGEGSIDRSTRPAEPPRS